MSRTHIPFSTGDISALARNLKEQIAESEGSPGHVELLNMLARAAGHRNFQSLRAQQVAREQLETPPPEPETVDFVQVRRLAGFFDAHGILIRWPAKPALQEICVWVLWSKLPSGESLSEAELNRLLRACHLFGDHALLRRELCDRGLVKRTADGRQYRRVERQPPAEARALVRHLGSREGAAGSGKGGAR